MGHGRDAIYTSEPRWSGRNRTAMLAAAACIHALAAAAARAVQCINVWAGMNVWECKLAGFHIVRAVLQVAVYVATRF